MLHKSVRFLAIDYGTKRVGFATCNEEETIVFSHKAYEMTGRESKDLENIAGIIESHDCRKIIVGLPLHLDGKLSKLGEKVVTFMENLRQKTNKAVIGWDERQTTKFARHMLRDVPLSKKRKKLHVNSVAAQLILQSYIDGRKIHDKPEETLSLWKDDTKSTDE